ncbi:membrane protein [Pseudidiomarina salinarum]|uniref:Membrane protein n=1 Tax=Pseudidiomarina salinarum TaxID=435908 RepID=A0A094IT68_9GAMM|nr:outer membrane lipoprotein-sorting protein [Pseudidiomarina salinarum]KFZ30332.1 membrane protein [Pseudidiomarina salinarum]RUO68485.1 outer membrane lipoprotein-sorting protein [Pseudidiomarina salinarum]
MRILTLLSLLAVTSVLPFDRAQAQEITDPHAIAKQAEIAAYYAGDDGRSAARMMITDAQGRTQLRQFIILRKDHSDGGRQDMLVFFSRPADVRDTVFRVAKNIEREDDRWLYLPGLDLIKRISAGDKRTSFVGSHFFYEDVSGRGTSLDDFELISETDAHYVLKATPLDPASVEFSHYEVRIDKNTMLPLKSRFYNAKGEAYREVEAVTIEEIQGYPTVTHSRVKDLVSGGQTEMQFRFTSYNLDLPDSIFSERSMRNPPTEWLELRD